MLPKKFRLKGRKEIQRVISQGKKITLENSDIYFIKNNLDYCRFCIVAKKKVFKKASQRNRAKRLVRESIRKNLKNLNLSYDFVVFAKESIFKKKLTDIATEFKNFFNKLNKNEYL